jgi:hypothetical protein
VGIAVYANRMSIACKAASGQSIAAFPDVCFTPPLTPATPPGVPIPYPNTGMASDTTDGSKTVQIGGQEVMLKNKSTFKTSTGDEAGSAPKKGVVTSQIKGKLNFCAWSMDVKFEGENVPRHLDLMGHNEASDPPNTPPWPYMDSMAVGAGDPCETEKKNEQDSCKDYKPNGDKDVCEDAGLKGGVLQSGKAAQAAGFSNAKSWAAHASRKAAANKCVSARRCRLSPYKADKDGVNGCCPSQTADHLVPKSSFFKVSFDHGEKLDGWENYDFSNAPCLCAEGGSNTAGSHGLRHAHHKANGPGKGSMQSFEQEADLAAKGASTVFKSSGCSEGCIKKQLENGHGGMGNTSGSVKHSPSGSTLTNDQITAQASQLSPTTVAE